jgi:predicted PurR-regulated permease PerM
LHRVTTFPEPLSDKIFVRRAVEAAIRIGLVALLVAWCFQIVRPFIVPVVWGIIIAVAVHPGYRRLETALGNHRTIAATLFTLLMLILLIGPTVMLAGTLAESAQGLAAHLTAGNLAIPPPESIGTAEYLERALSARKQASLSIPAIIRSSRLSAASGSGCPAS